MFKENLELRKRVFEKLGWEEKRKQSRDIIQEWPSIWTPPDVWEPQELPPIETSWEVCAQYLVPFMLYKVRMYAVESDGYFWWIVKNKNKMWVRDQGAEIISDNIALAACEAFMEVKI